MLSVSERVRAANLVHADDVRRFLARRIALRRVLAGLLGVPPHALELVTDAAGRPTFRGVPLAFSTASRGRCGVVAAGDAAAIGIDLEPRSAARDVLEARAAIFSAGEESALERSAPEERERLALRAWCLKEAQLKARGTGLRTDPRRIAGVEPARGLGDRGWTSLGGPWMARAITSRGGEVEAILVIQPHRRAVGGSRASRK